VVVEQLPTMVLVLPGEAYLASSPHKVASCTPFRRQQSPVIQVHRQSSFTSHLLQAGMRVFSGLVHSILMNERKRNMINKDEKFFIIKGFLKNDFILVKRQLGLVACYPECFFLSFFFWYKPYFAC